MSCQSAHTLTPVFDISRHLSTAHTLCPSGTLFLFYLRYKSEVAERRLDKGLGEKSKAKLMLVKWKHFFWAGGRLGVGGVCSARAGIDLFRYEGPKESEALTKKPTFLWLHHKDAAILFHHRSRFSPFLAGAVPQTSCQKTRAFSVMYTYNKAPDIYFFLPFMVTLLPFQVFVSFY